MSEPLIKMINYDFKSEINYLTVRRSNQRKLMVKTGLNRNGAKRRRF
jgi:uncharacterized protein YuzE